MIDRTMIIYLIINSLSLPPDPRGTTEHISDSKVHGANMGPTWALSAPGGPHVGPMNVAIWAYLPGLVCQDSLVVLEDKRHMSPWDWPAQE